MNYSITDFGAMGDGKTLNTEAIQAAIEACTASGGGRVTVPAGKFLSGTIQLKSNADLHLESGAELISSLDPADLPDLMGGFEDDNRDTGWEGGCFLLARHAEHVTISGSGRIDGRGREVFYEDDADGGSHESPLKVRGFRPRMSFLEDVRGLTVKDVSFYDAAFWTLHMAGCLDEQPSRRGVYPFEVPMAYIRSGENIAIREGVRYRIDESMRPYTRETFVVE